MAHFLFITWHGGGNEPPTIGIAQELKDRGHTVTFAGYESQHQRVADRGFPFVAIDPLSGSWRDLPLDQRVRGEIDQVWICPDHLYQIPELVARQPVDAILVDCMMSAAQAAVENLDIPYAVLVHTTAYAFRADGMHNQHLMGPINAVRERAGRPTFATLWESWSYAPVICATLPELDAASGQVPSSFRYVGPVFERVPASGWQSPWSEDDPRPLVLVSFSTHNQEDQTSRINRTLEALGGDRYRVLLTPGMVNLQAIEIPEHATVVHYLPHGEILPETKVVVTHAGHGTVTTSLSYGVPMVCMPNVRSDQPENAARLAELGAGLVLDGDTATPAEIGQAVAQLMSDPAYAAAAGRLAASIEASHGAQSAASMLEELV